MGRSFVGFAVGVAAAGLLVIVGLVSVGHALAVSDPLEPADAIVAISGDAGPRVATAVALWREGYAANIVFSGGSVDPDSVSSAEIMKRRAVALGVPEDRILVEPESRTTLENAEEVADLLAHSGLRSAILVTSPYHQRRAWLHFARAFDRYGLALRNHPAADPEWDATLWWTREPSRTLTAIELAKLAVESVDGRLERPGLPGQD